MTATTNTLHSMSITSLYFLTAVALTFGGFWSLFQIDASLFTLILFGLLMMPSLFSTGFYLSRDISKATHILIA